MQPNFKVAQILSWLITFLAVVTSAGGLFIDGVYRDNSLVVAACQGNDIVTLFVVVPLMVFALYKVNQQSQRAQLIWIGTLGYMLYNYVFYLYGVAFNLFFPLYVALFSLSVYALIFSISKLEVDSIFASFKASIPTKYISGYMVFFPSLLGALWLSRWYGFVTTGQVPQDILQTNHPTAVVYATDLAFLVPAVIVSAVLLWQRRPWGYILSPIVLVKCSAYSLVLIVMSGFAYLKVGTWDPLTPLWVALSLGAFICCWLLLGNMSKKYNEGERM